MNWASPQLHWPALAVYLIAAVGGLLSVRQRSAQARAMYVIVAAAVGAGFIGGALTTLGYLACAAASIAVGVWARVDRRQDAARWNARAVDPLVLRSPFRDDWRVVAGGPDPRHNHHQSVSDQYFAYDFVCKDGASWDAEILAPCDGTVAWTEDRHEDAPPDKRHRDFEDPAGNYVSIDSGSGCVILAHLRKGSIIVLPGTRVNAGDAIGRCGNSGNTSRSHLHIHAQNRPQIAVGIAEGIPIAFIDKAGKAWVLEYGDTLSS